jgi:hypothetical protein
MNESTRTPVRLSKAVGNLSYPTFAKARKVAQGLAQKLYEGDYGVWVAMHGTRVLVPSEDEATLLWYHGQNIILDETHLYAFFALPIDRKATYTTFVDLTTGDLL